MPGTSSDFDPSKGCTSSCMFRCSRSHVKQRLVSPKSCMFRCSLSWCKVRIWSRLHRHLVELRRVLGIKVAVRCRSILHIWSSRYGSTLGNKPLEIHASRNYPSTCVMADQRIVCRNDQVARRARVKCGFPIRHLGLDVQLVPKPVRASKPSAPPSAILPNLHHVKCMLR